MHVNLFKFFQKVIKNVDQSLNNYIDIIFNNFVLKKLLFFRFIATNIYVF